MDPLTFEQHAIAASMLGRQVQLLVPEMRVQIEFVNGSPVSVQFPDSLELRVVDTAPAMHNTQDSTWKPARLENGIEINVPQFVKTGDVVRVDTADLRYMDRVRTASR
jgi:elongation factor P